MVSFRARVLIKTLQYRHIFQGKLKKEKMPFSVNSVLDFREKCEKGAKRFGKVPKNVSVKSEIIHKVYSEWIVPACSAKDKLIFYVHGGGYVSGSCNDHRTLVSKIALNSEIPCLLFEYGVAPENPFPTGLNDALNVYNTVLEKGYKAENIVIMGESAGGGLCLSVLLALKDRNIPLPKAAVAIQPWTDLSCSGNSYFTMSGKSLAPLNCWNVFSKYYIASNEPANPYISPLNGDLANLPPVYINVGEYDELYDDSIGFYEKAKNAGVEITLDIGKEMVHCYPLLAPLFKEASIAYDKIISFIKEQLAE